MQNISVDKNRLLDTLRANRDEHQSLFLTAQEEFRKRLVKELDERLQNVRAGRKVEMFIALQVPTDYTEAFDQAISMIEWDQGDTVTLSEKDFQRYVLNKWEWAQAFAASTQSYLAR